MMVTSDPNSAYYAGSQVAAAAIGAAAGNVAGQGTAMLMGVQKNFDW